MSSILDFSLFDSKYLNFDILYPIQNLVKISLLTIKFLRGSTLIFIFFFF